MTFGPESLLVISVAVVGVLHTVVPDHWVPITLIARQRGWSKGETARAALQAGTGHVVTTLIIAAVIWFAGVEVAAQFGHFIDTAASIALVGFGLWIAISSWRELSAGNAHGHSHGGHGHSHSHSFSFLGAEGNAGIHGPELQRIDTGHGVIDLSIFESGVPPRFRLTGEAADRVQVETIRETGEPQLFPFVMRSGYWESVDEIPEPHGFDVTVTIEHDGHAHSHQTSFAEHEHGHDHGDNGHSHGGEAAPGEKTKTSTRTALLLILGSSPMIEGIPAFFAAGKYGVGLIVVMSIVFAISTIATYVVLCVYSTAGLRRIHLGPLERYGEITSGAFIALVGVAFWLWPVI